MNRHVEIGSWKSNFVDVTRSLARAAELAVDFRGIECLRSGGQRKQRHHDNELKKSADAHLRFSPGLTTHDSNKENRNCLRIVASGFSRMRLRLIPDQKESLFQSQLPRRGERRNRRGGCGDWGWPRGWRIFRRGSCCRARPCLRPPPLSPAPS